MTDKRLIYDWHMTDIWLIYDGYMKNIWLIYDWYMTDIWRIYDWYMNDIGLTYDWHMTDIILIKYWYKTDIGLMYDWYMTDIWYMLMLWPLEVTPEAYHRRSVPSSPGRSFYLLWPFQLLCYLILQHRRDHIVCLAILPAPPQNHPGYTFKTAEAHNYRIKWQII